jgi:hypothetical protein
MMMARKPNYDFERRERERLKAEKKAQRAAEKKEARQNKTDLESSTQSLLSDDAQAVSTED